MPCKRNIYQAVRESAGLTQEVAAERLDTSPESIRAYESGRRVPPDHIVVRMVAIYGDARLAYQHLAQNSLIGEAVLPPIEERALSEATLRLMHVLRDFVRNDRVNVLVDIAEDGKIDDREAPLYGEVMGELRELVKAYYQLEYAR